MSKRNSRVIYEKTCKYCGSKLHGRQRSWCSHVCEVSAWQQRNKDKARRYKQDYIKNNPERRKESIKKYDKSEKARKIRREWISKNRQRMREPKVIQTQKQRAKRMGLEEHFTREEWQALKKKYDHKCLCCGKQEPEIVLTVDHIFPLALGGINTIENIQPLCGTCNRKKLRQEIDYRD